MKHLFIFIITTAFIGFLSGQDINPRTVDYKKVDSIVLSLKPDKYATPLLLTNFLNATFKKDHERLRAVFRWVTNNITYNQNSSNNPDEVYITKYAVCQGYSELIKYLCDLTKIECLIIKGTAKTDLSYIENPISLSNHAWNMVTLYNKQYLLDATWASGYINMETQSFTKEYCNAYYLTKPEIFILQHLPLDPEFQLVINSISTDEFYTTPIFNDGAIIYELKSFIPNKAKVSTSIMEKTHFLFETDLKISKLEISINSDPNTIYEEIIPVDFVQKDDKISFDWIFESKGTFYLSIYFDEEKTISYKIEI